MSNQLQIGYDYRDNRGKSVDLEKWLAKHKNDLYNKRVFYVLKANLDKTITKIGIAGNETGKASAYGRLHQYIILYGNNNKNDKCQGVQLYCIRWNTYNQFITPTNSSVYRKELQIKRNLKMEDAVVAGSERTRASLDKIFQMIDDPSNKTDEDKQDEIRRSTRIKQSALRPSDRILKVVDIFNTGKSKTKYLVEWSRPYIDSKTGLENNRTWETYNLLEFITNGPEAVAEYKSKYAKKKYID